MEMNRSKYHWNTTDSNEDIEMLVEDRDPWVVLAVTLIGVIIFVGCTGNFMVLLAVKKVKKLQTVSNIFVMNLSVCDLLFVGFVLPFNIYTYIADGWYIAEALCKFVGFMGYTLTGTTIITITLIAYNRYKLVLDPGDYKKFYSRTNIIIMLLVAWLVPVIFLLPALLGVWGKFGYVVMLVTCNLLLDHKSQLFKIFLMIARAGIPCGLIVYYYARIYHTTKHSHRKLNKNTKTMSALDLHNQRKEMHMTRMMLMIFVVFVISYFPCTITGIVDWNTVLSKPFHMFCQISIYIGSAINPLVYGLMNSQFRHAYKRMICCFRKALPDHKSSGLQSLKTSFLEKNKICRKSPDLKYFESTEGSSPIRAKCFRFFKYSVRKSTSYTKDFNTEPLLNVIAMNPNVSKPKFTLE